MESYRQAARFTAETLKRPVNALAFNADGRLLAVCSDDYSVHIVAIETKRKVYHRIATHGGPMGAAQWLADARGGHWLFTAGNQGIVCVFYVKLVNDILTVDAESVAPITLGDGQEEIEVKNLVMDSSGHHLAAISAGRVFLLSVNANSSTPLTVTHWYPPEGQPAEGASACGAAFCSVDEGNALVVAYTDSHLLRVFRLNPWARMWDRHTSFKPLAITWVAEEQCFLIYCVESLAVKVVEIRQGQIEHKKTLRMQPPNEHRYLKQVRSAEHGRLALCGSDRGALICWDLLSGDQLPVSLEHGRGDEGKDGGYPGLQVVASKSLAGGKHVIASSTYVRRNPCVLLWENDGRPYRPSNTLFHFTCGAVCALVVAGWFVSDKLGIKLTWWNPAS